MFVGYANMSEETIRLSILRCKDNGVDILIQQRTSSLCLSSVYVEVQGCVYILKELCSCISDELSIFHSSVQGRLSEVGWLNPLLSVWVNTEEQRFAVYSGSIGWLLIPPARSAVVGQSSVGLPWHFHGLLQLVMSSRLL